MSTPTRRTTAQGGAARVSAAASPGIPKAGGGPALLPDLEQFVIEDGKPVDGILTEKQMRLLTEPLQTGWAAPGGQPFVVMANVGVFIGPGIPPLAPDVLLAVGVRQGTDLTDRANLSYFVWLRGKLPDVVVEIVSNRKGGEGGRKLRDYARFGVPNYVIFDPADKLRGGVLRVFELRGRRYRALEEPYFFAGVGLGVRLWEGAFEGIARDWLRWCDRGGRVIPTGVEQRGAEGRRAERQKRRAEQQKRRADAAEKELARLREKLREMGVEPPD